MQTISENLKAIEKKIHAAMTASDLHTTVKLLAVSKTQCAEKIRIAFGAGQYCFGENYAQEALDKIYELRDLPIEWHFIGRIQANKTRTIAEHFSWVHTVDRKNIATRLNNQRPIELPSLQVCIQVNLAHEPQKAGIVIEDIFSLAQHIQQLPQLKLRGLMTLPPATLVDYTQQYHYFQQLAQLNTQLQHMGFSVDTLSMGMSHDFPVAIAAGATWVRIGTAIFGERK